MNQTSENEHTETKHPEAEFPKFGFVRLRQIIGDAKRGIPPAIPVGKSYWWEGVREGRFPRPIKLSPRVIVWRAEEIRELIERQCSLNESASAAS